MLLFILRYAEDLDLEDAINTAIQTLRQNFEGQLSAKNLQVGVVETAVGGFRLLSTAQIEEHLALA